MKNLRVFLAVLLTMTLLPFQAALASEKTVDMYVAEDLHTEYWAYEQISDFMAADIIDGSAGSDGNVYVNPDNSITRAQFVKMLVNALDLKTSAPAVRFTDVHSGDWFYPYVQAVSSHGIVTGVNGKFSPNEKIKRDQMAAIIYRAFKKTVQFKTTAKTFKDVSGKHWAYEHIKKAAANGIINGYTADNTFKPAAYATRAQGIVMIHRALQQEHSTLPAGQALESFLRNHILEEGKTLEASNTAGALELFKKNTTGHYYATGLDSIEMYNMMKNQNMQIMIKTNDDFTLKATSLTNRYATFEISNVVSTVSIKNSAGAVIFEEDMKLSGKYSLKLHGNGSWKIYNFSPDEQTKANNPFFSAQ